MHAINVLRMWPVGINCSHVSLMQLASPVLFIIVIRQPAPRRRIRSRFDTDGRLYVCTYVPITVHRHLPVLKKNIRK